MAILCGAGAHVCSFSSVHAASAHQTNLMGMSYTWSMAFFGMGLLALALFILGYLIYTAKKRAGLLENDEYMDKTDDVENDFGSMAFSVVWTMFVRFLITGHHPEDEEAEVEEPHTPKERTAMLIYTVIAFVAAGIIVKICNA